MDKNDIIGLFGFTSLGIGTYMISPEAMFIICGLAFIGLALAGARKEVKNK